MKKVSASKFTNSMKKVSASKFTNSVNNMANNVNINVNKIIKNEMAINLIRVLIILYTSFAIPVLNTNTLEILNNNVVRLVICSLIVYLSFMDVITAVLLTIAFVLTIHQGKNKVGAKNNNAIQDIELNQGNSDIVNRINNLTNIKVENYEDLNKALNGPSGSGATNNLNGGNGNNLNGGNGNNLNGGGNNLEENKPGGYNTNGTQLANINSEGDENNLYDSKLAGINNQVDNLQAGNNLQVDINNIPGGMVDSVGAPFNNATANNATANNAQANNANTIIKKLSIDEINKKHPASNTMTDNILAVGASLDQNGPMGLTTSQNLYDISENAVPGADIMNQVISVDNSLSAQGMNSPIGANYARHNGYPMKDGKGLVHNILRNDAVKQ